MRFLVTAGNTRERIDDVRDWGNIFTGNTGFGIARALAGVGTVDLLSSNRQHLSEAGAARLTHPVIGHAFTSHAELRHALQALMNSHSYDAVFMVAAVSDYKPAGAFAVLSTEPTGTPGEQRWIVRDVHAGKIKSNHDTIAIVGKQTEKLVDLFRSAWGFKGLLVKFKLEVGLDDAQLIEVGQRSRRASGAEYLVANTLSMVEGAGAGAYLLSDTGNEWVPRQDLAGRLVELVAPGT